MVIGIKCRLDSDWARRRPALREVTRWIPGVRLQHFDRGCLRRSSQPLLPCLRSPRLPRWRRRPHPPARRRLAPSPQATASLPSTGAPPPRRATSPSSTTRWNTAPAAAATGRIRPPTASATTPPCRPVQTRPGRTSRIRSNWARRPAVPEATSPPTSRLSRSQPRTATVAPASTRSSRPSP